MAYIASKLREEVRTAAQSRCEYCLLGEAYTEFKHEFDHIIATQHGGTTAFENITKACFDCNRQKGPKICSMDLDTGDVVRLFDPRHQRWTEHFRLQGAVIEPLTASARATVRVLNMNDPDRIEDRKELLNVGLYP